MTKLHVCPLSDLVPTLEASRARWMISLSGPGKSPSRPNQIDRNFLALEFNDIAEPRPGLSPPSREHVGQILHFLSEWNGEEDLLIHCWMGISRSTAAAAIAMAHHDPEQDMVQLALSLRQASPTATPNPLMISIADDMIGLGGRLGEAIASIGRGEETSQGAPFVMQIS